MHRGHQALDDAELLLNHPVVNGTYVSWGEILVGFVGVQMWVLCSCSSAEEVGPFFWGFPFWMCYSFALGVLGDSCHMETAKRIYLDDAGAFPCTQSVKYGCLLFSSLYPFWVCCKYRKAYSEVGLDAAKRLLSNTNRWVAGNASPIHGRSSGSCLQVFSMCLCCFG